MERGGCLQAPQAALGVALGIDGGRERERGNAGGAPRGFQQADEAIGVELMTEGRGMEVLKVLLPAKLTGCNTVRDFLGKVERRVAVANRHRLVLLDGNGSLACTVVGGVFGHGEVQVDDIAGGNRLAQVPHDPLHASEHSCGGREVGGIVDRRFHKEEVRLSVGEHIAL